MVRYQIYFLSIQPDVSNKKGFCPPHSKLNFTVHSQWNCSQGWIIYDVIDDVTNNNTIQVLLFKYLNN